MYLLYRPEMTLDFFRNSVDWSIIGAPLVLVLQVSEEAIVTALASNILRPGERLHLQ